MLANIEKTILELLSHNEPIRKRADETISNYFNSMQINDLSNFYSILEISSNNNVKMYISIFIKNFIEQKINSENREEFIKYIGKYKYDILKIILNSALENKTINLLILSLCKGLTFLQIDMKIYNQTVLELSSYILQFYINQRNAQNKNVTFLSKSLFICSKFIKYIDKEINNIKYANIYKLDKLNNGENIDNYIENEDKNLELLNTNFYNMIVEDYSVLCQSIMDSKIEIWNNNNYLIEYLILYLKIFKYSLNYLELNNREKILDINYKLILFIFNQIVNTNNNLFNNIFLVKSFGDILSLSNKIIIKYISTHALKITLNTTKKYISFFYSFISSDNLLSSLSYFFKLNNNDNNDTKLFKFIEDIIDFLHVLINLIYADFREYKIISKKNNGNNYKEMIDYIGEEFLTEERIKEILYFIIKKCLTFNEYDISIAQENYENFYLCFTEFNSLYDIKTKSGELCNLIYAFFGKKYSCIFQEFENNLISLTIKENELMQINQKLSGEESNLKCALLLFFYYLDDYFSLNKKDEEKINKILLEQIDIEIINNKEKEIFSSFIILRLLTKMISNYYGKSNFKKKILEKVNNIFFSDKIKESLLELACFDLFNDYIDMQLVSISGKANNIKEDIFPDFFMQKYIIKICQMINKISSPELQSKVVETTKNIIDVINKDKLYLDFNLIIPSLELIWENKYSSNITNLNENNVSFLTRKNIDIKNKNKIYIVRRNLVKLMNIIIKKIGFYTYNNESNSKNNSNFLLFHNFIYKIINYSLICKRSEETDYLYREIYNLIILIQDNYAKSISLYSYNDINSMKNLLNIIDNDNNFMLFSKFFDFFNIILEQSSNCSNNQYFISQLFIIEQFLSFCFIPKINNFIENENFVDKIIYVLNNMLIQELNDYYQIIFNIMEYILYIINTFSNFNLDNKNKYIDFIYQFIVKIINGFELNTNNFNIYFGSIQLANRLIYVNACKNIISDEFNKQISDVIISLSKFHQLKKNEISLNFIQKNVLQNCLNNLWKLLNINNNDVKRKSLIKELYDDIRRNNKHNSDYDCTSYHWLFFFNKITNDLHFYKFTSDEEKLRYDWNEKFNIKQIFFSINKEFEVKYFFLKIDPMMKEK